MVYHSQQREEEIIATFTAFLALCALMAGLSCSLFTQHFSRLTKRPSSSACPRRSSDRRSSDRPRTACRSPPAHAAVPAALRTWSRSVGSDDLFTPATCALPAPAVTPGPWGLLIRVSQMFRSERGSKGSVSSSISSSACSWTRDAPEAHLIKAYYAASPTQRRDALLALLTNETITKQLQGGAEDGIDRVI